MNEMRKLMEAVDQLMEYNDVRQTTVKILEAMDDGMMDPRSVADAALSYMSESEVDEMARINDWSHIIRDEEDDDEFEESVSVIREDNEMEDIANELSDIKEQIAELVHMAGNLVDSTDERDAARRYWIGHIMGALDTESEYMGSSMTTMQDTIDAIRMDAGDDDEDDGSWEYAARVNDMQGESLDEDDRGWDTPEARKKFKTRYDAFTDYFAVVKDAYGIRPKGVMVEDIVKFVRENTAGSAYTEGGGYGGMPDAYIGARSKQEWMEIRQSLRDAGLSR